MIYIKNIFINNNMNSVNQNLLSYKNPLIDESSKIMASLDKPKISKLIMTIYEFNQIIGLRTTQLSLGAIPFVKIENNIKSNIELRKIAVEELKQGKLPLIIKRPLPNNKFEFVRVKDLDLVRVKYLFD